VPARTGRQARPDQGRQAAGAAGPLGAHTHTFQAIDAAHPTGGIFTADQKDISSYGVEFDTRWVTVHDTSVDRSGLAFDANALAKTAGATPLKRPENGVFRPGTGFREFFFETTGDTNAASTANAGYGGWGTAYRFWPPATDSTTRTTTKSPASTCPTATRRRPAFSARRCRSPSAAAGGSSGPSSTVRTSPGKSSPADSANPVHGDGSAFVKVSLMSANIDGGTGARLVASNADVTHDRGGPAMNASGQGWQIAGGLLLVGVAIVAAIVGFRRPAGAEEKAPVGGGR
jgi:hypothetical protein